MHVSHPVVPLPHFLSLKNECNQKAKGFFLQILLCPYKLLSPPTACPPLHAHFFACFDLKMQWEYLAFRWHAAGELWWISGFQRTEFLRQHCRVPVGWSDRQSDRSQDVRQGRQWNTKCASVLQEGWHSRDGSSGCWECQCTAQTAVSPWLLWLAKQIISFLIMISRVIIYTKVAHSPIIRRQGSCFLPPVKGKTACFHVFSSRWIEASYCSQRNKAEHCLSPCPTANVIKFSICG